MYISKQFVTGVLITLGILAITDNIIVHWMLKWHRVLDNNPELSTIIEIMLVVLGIVLVIFGMCLIRNTQNIL